MTQPRLFRRGTGHQPTMPAVIFPSVTSCTKGKERNCRSVVGKMRAEDEEVEKRAVIV